MSKKIAYQGEAGANSHIACIEAYPGHEPLACGTFEDAFQAVKDGEVALAMIPIDNSVAGRVADIHHLMPRSNLYIVGEHFLRVHHQLLAIPGADRAKLRTVHSHVHALGQCRKVIRELNLKPVVAADTAGAAGPPVENEDEDDGSDDDGDGDAMKPNAVDAGSSTTCLAGTAFAEIGRAHV